jgi:hypothetical protein
MTFPQSGGCLCGMLRYQIRQTPKVIYTCHCTDCQRLTGAAFAVALAVAGDAFSLAGAEPKPLQRRTDRGTMSTRWICPDCGTWICGGTNPGSAHVDALRIVRAGTLDDTSWVRPTVHFWTRSAQPWVVLPPADRLFATQPSDVRQFLSEYETQAGRPKNGAGRMRESPERHSCREGSTGKSPPCLLPERRTGQILP